MGVAYLTEITMSIIVLKTISDVSEINESFYNELIEEIDKMIPDPIKKKLSSPRIRRKMLETCGEKAFLLPDQLKFPVMDPERCEYHCGLLYAAYMRARQHKYTDAANKARSIFKDNACDRKVGVRLESGDYIALEDFTFIFE